MDEKPELNLPNLDERAARFAWDGEEVEVSFFYGDKTITRKLNLAEPIEFINGSLPQLPLAGGLNPHPQTNQLTTPQVLWLASQVTGLTIEVRRDKRLSVSALVLNWVPLKKESARHYYCFSPDC